MRKKRGKKSRHSVKDRRFFPHQSFENRVWRRPLGHENRRRADGERKGERVPQAVGEEQLRRREHDIGFANTQDRLGVKLCSGDEV
jgi:hypothetical protein